ncbi:MAG TPA: hypothetical protein VIL00_07800 [Pseudonocardiaceae bacterium]
MSRRGVVALAVAGLLTAGVVPALAEPVTTSDGLPRSPELTETERLADRRAVVTGDRFYSVSSADGLFPAMGWHITGEMGGYWAQPVKLLDGMWFAVNGKWLGAQVPARSFTSGWGYTRVDYGTANGVRIHRTEFAPSGLRAGLVGLTLAADSPTELTLTMNAHSELMTPYPWGWTTPSQAEFNLPDTGEYGDGALIFREQGTPPVPNAEAHDFAAVVGSNLRPQSHRLGPDFRGPQSNPVICPIEGEQPERCDDSGYGKGTGGELTYRIKVGRKPTTVWFAVAGSDQGLAEARAEYRRALADPEKLLRAELAEHRAAAANTVVDLPGDRLLQQSVEWSKQNLVDSVQESRNLRLRITEEGKQYPTPVGELARARWLGAGWPDYPWLFGTDGEYTAFASVAMGQFDDIKAHLRALKEVSEIVNAGSGKVVHEVIHDGSVYFGTNEDAGNTDETAKFPSAVALVWRWTGDDAFRDELYDFTVRNMRYIARELDADGDGWPEGLGNVERSGMGAEKLDNAVYTIRGLRDLADMARSKGDTETESWATAWAEDLEQRFEETWWVGGDADQYGDSLSDEDGSPMLQRHWIGVTPMDAELVRPGQVTRPLASDEHGEIALRKREEECYSDEFGLYHTGTGPTSADGGNRGPSCDSEVSTVQSERSIYSLNTAIMAVAEGNFGRLGPDQQRRYTTANARIQLDPSVWEMPGAMPEIAPSPDFGANIDRRFTDRAMVLQAWGAYGVLWPVVHHQLGVSPDMGRDRLSVVPQLPEGQDRISGSNIRVGTGAVDVTATRNGKVLRTEVVLRTGAELTIGQVLPEGATVRSVVLDGRPVDHQVVRSARGEEVLVAAGARPGRHTLVIQLA